MTPDPLHYPRSRFHGTDRGWRGLGGDTEGWSSGGSRMDQGRPGNMSRDARDISGKDWDMSRKARDMLG